MSFIWNLKPDSNVFNSLQEGPKGSINTFKETIFNIQKRLNLRVILLMKLRTAACQTAVIPY